LALAATCTSLDLYGFGASEDQGYGHYWDARKPEEIDEFRWQGSPAHVFSREQRIMHELANGTFESKVFREWMPSWLPAKYAP
jgi:hypothetical protein